MTDVPIVDVPPIVLEQIAAQLETIEDFREVSGAAGLKAALENADNLPGAYVFEASDRAKPNQSADAVMQVKSVQFAVVLLIENFTDDFGGDSAVRMKKLRDKVEAVLLGFMPTGQQSALEYVGGRMYSFKLDVLAQQDNYVLPESVIYGDIHASV